MRPKAIMALVAATSAAIVFQHFNPPTPTSPRELADLIIAHRAGVLYWPENTLHGIERSWLSEIGTVELDVQVTKDDQLVIIHDDTVDRTTNGTGLVSDHTLAELRQLDAGYYWLSPSGAPEFRGKGIQIPTMEEVISYAAKIKIILDLKNYTPSALGKLCTDITTRNLQHKIWLYSSDDQDLIEIRKICGPQIYTNLSFQELSRLGSIRRSIHKNRYILLTYAQFSQDQYQNLGRLADRYNLPLYVSFINEPLEAVEVIVKGATGIMTERPINLKTHIMQNHITKLFFSVTSPTNQ